MSIAWEPVAEATPAAEAAPETIRKISIIVSKGSLEGVYPALILANGARMEGIEEVALFFTFFGMDAIVKKRNAKLRVATVGNPAMHMPTLVGALPGMSAVATKMMQREMERLDFPPVPEFLGMISASGAKLYACKASVDMFRLDESDFIDELDGVLTVGDFYGLAAGGVVLFT